MAEQDYRVLQPFRLTDPNGNRQEVAFDTLGLVVGAAVMGKAGETQGDSLADFAVNLTPQQRDEFLADPLTHAAALLGSASTRVVYDLDRFQREGQPVFAALLARETHASEPAPAAGLNVRVSLSYSDGFGREIQNKIAAEPGPLMEGGAVVNPRWIGSGWTILNNKGKPVKRFEPFFDDAHEFRFDQQAGVSSTLLYDPVGRIIATLHPNHTWEKVVFNPWRQETWDVNDTVLIEDPKQDADVGGFLQRLDPSEYLPTWHAQRQGGELGAAEREAAEKAAVHAATPAVAHADALGRPFLTIAHNRFKRNDAVTEETYASRVIFDIEGNEREIVDANGRVVMRYDFDMIGARVHQTSMEAGERWILNDVVGQPVFTWNSRAHRLRSTYDALRRPLNVFLQEGSDPERLISRTVFGESVPAAALTAPDGSITRPQFNATGLLQKVEAQLRGATTPTVFVTQIDYDAKGQRTSIVYGNGLRTTYAYDPLTFRLTLCRTLRGSERLQDLGYVYDPAGNITHIQDDARQILYFNNAVISPTNEYTYDAIYRLLATQGREHIGQMSQPETTWNDAARINLPHPNDGQAMRRYSEQYTYDAVGNLLRVAHSATNGSWNRNFT